MSDEENKIDTPDVTGSEQKRWLSEDKTESPTESTTDKTGETGKATEDHSIEDGSKGRNTDETNPANTDAGKNNLMDENGKPLYGALLKDYPGLKNAQTGAEGDGSGTCPTLEELSNGFEGKRGKFSGLPDDLKKQFAEKLGKDPDDPELNDLDFTITNADAVYTSVKKPSKIRSIVWFLIGLCIVFLVVAPWNFLNTGDNVSASESWTATQTQAKDILKSVETASKTHANMKLESDSAVNATVVKLVDSSNETIQVWKLTTYGDPSTVSFTPVYKLYALADGNYKLVYGLKDKSDEIGTKGLAKPDVREKSNGSDFDNQGKAGVGKDKAATGDLKG